MCSFSGATCTSRVRHNADYVPYAKIRFDLRQRVASLTLNCNGDFAIRAYCSSFALVALFMRKQWCRVRHLDATIKAAIRTCVEGSGRIHSFYYFLIKWHY